MSKTDKPLSSSSWQASVRVVEEFLKTDCKLDELFGRLTKDLDGGTVRRVQYLSYGVVRNLGWLQWSLSRLVSKAPKKRLSAILLVAMFEWSEAGADVKPQVVHNAVEQSKRMLSQPETRFVNAVLRKLANFDPGINGPGNSPDSLSVVFSHPLWLVERWLNQFGEPATKAFLEWNQQLPKNYAWSPVPVTEIPADWISTKWAGFYEIQGVDWTHVRDRLARGEAYIQDPSTRIGPGLVDGRKVVSILDLCAAPGGKSIQLQRWLKEEGGLLVSVDLPGQRFDRLKDNLNRYRLPGVNQLQVGRDVLYLQVEDLPQPDFDVVYVDVPCSNTGVLQRRPDVKWRQTMDSLGGLAVLQQALLGKGAEFVKPGGYLIYSTCSVEEAENESIVTAFLKEARGRFQVDKSETSLPWLTGHDGAFACLLRQVD